MTLILSLIIGTVLIALFSLFSSIRDRLYHGLVRFFSFESILVLILLNAKHWFERPFSVLQVVSWALLAASAFLAVHGFILLHRLGKPEHGIEMTTRLVTLGAYRFIRHPLYGSLALLGTGTFLKHVDWLTAALAAANILAAYFTARIEEKEMLAKFGAEYAAYMARTKMFIPFIF